MKLYQGVYLIICIAIMATFSSCLEIKERVYPGKKGKGELRLELSLTYFKMFADTVDWEQKIRAPLESLEEALAQKKGVSQVQAQISSEAGIVSLSLSYASLEALNEALTFLYLGGEEPSFPFFEQVAGQWTRNQPPKWGDRVRERWEELWGEKLLPEDQEAVKFRYLAKFKSSIGLVYAPFQVELEEEKREVLVELDSSDLFEEKSSQIKILTK